MMKPACATNADHANAEPSQKLHRTTKNVVMALLTLVSVLAALLPGVSPAMAQGKPAGGVAGTAVLYTSLRPPACATSSRTPAAQRGVHERIPYICPAPGSRTAWLDYHGTYVTLAIGEGDNKPKAVHASAPYDIGPRIEWRGARGGGVFEPHAAIVRLHVRLASGRSASALGVLRLGDGARSLCLAAIADGRDANLLARAFADGDARSFDCASPPMLIGPGGEAAKEIAERNKRPD